MFLNCITKKHFHDSGYTIFSPSQTPFAHVLPAMFRRQFCWLTVLQRSHIIERTKPAAHIGITITRSNAHSMEIHGDDVVCSSDWQHVSNQLSRNGRTTLDRKQFFIALLKFTVEHHHMDISIVIILLHTANVLLQYIENTLGNQ